MERVRAHVRVRFLKRSRLEAYQMFFFATEIATGRTNIGPYQTGKGDEQEGSSPT
jgi:hypothetical protein